MKKSKGMRTAWWVLGICVLIIIGLFAGLKTVGNGNNSSLANPASVYCIERGGNNGIITDENGSQAGVCMFEDGTSCDEWAFYRGECKKGAVNSCVIDSDCVPDSCCHAKACTAKQNAPKCAGILCTMDCESGTIDCGGSCKCENNQCKAVIGS